MMTAEQLATLVSWLREQAEDGAHQPPSDHAKRFTEAADYIESTSRALAAREKLAMTDERWAELRSWTWFKEAQAEVTIELDRSRAAEASLRADLAFEQAWRAASELGDACDELQVVRTERDAAVARIAELEAAVRVDLGRADRDAIYRHDLKALAADGASDGCHTDVGTIVRIRLAGLQAELAELRPKPACGNRFMAHVCIKREGHRDLHGDGDGGEWS